MSHLTLDVMHLAHLGGLLQDRPWELGPAPVEVPDQVRALIADQLHQSGLTNSGATEVTEQGAALLEPLVTYRNAYWGFLTLQNQLQPVTFDIDPQWLQHLEEALITASVAAPKIYFLLAEGHDGLMTAAVRMNNQVQISQHTTAHGLAAAASQFIQRLADPQGRWAPAPITPLAVPYEALSVDQVPPRPPASDTDPQTRSDYLKHVRRWTTTVRTAHNLDARSTLTLRTMLEWDHIASAQVLYSSGPQRKTPQHAVTVDYFHDHGVAVSTPRRLADGTFWRHIAPATDKAVTGALNELAKTPAKPREHLASATAPVPSAEQTLSGLVDDETLAKIRSVETQLATDPTPEQ